MRFPVRFGCAAVLCLALWALGSAIPPRASYDGQLPDGAYLHMLALPLGRLDGAIVGQAHFDRGGQRAAFIATFPGATLEGDWRTLNPTQAFVLDATRRTLTQLTIDGQAHSISWSGDQTVAVQDGDRRNQFAVAQPLPIFLPARRMAAPSEAPGSTVIAQGGDGRFFVAKAPNGRYLIEQIGARTLAIKGTAANGAYAIVGHFLVWVDRSRHAGAEISRAGAHDAVPPSFAGSAFGNDVLPLFPLGHPVYQGAYRNGVVYFGFMHGVRRIIAGTSDLLSYWFPPIPNDLSYSVGDGFGAGANNQLYFARPESNDLTFWHHGKYVHQTLTLPSQGSQTALEYAMRHVAPADPLWPPLRPDTDALDAAILQWRVYPVGDAVGQAWIASYLGRVLIGNSAGSFRFVNQPQFPLAVLGRTDDGRIWGASPQLRLFAGPEMVDATSTLWWTRNGMDWLQAATVPGDVGAVGLDHRRVWVAYTHPWLGRAEIWLLRLGQTSGVVTGGTYAGEQLFFATLDSGFWLVWGATPGWRLNGDEGPLSAYRVDPEALYALGSGADNLFAQQIEDPNSDPSLPSAVFDAPDAAALAVPSLDALAALPGGPHATLATNLDGVTVDSSKVTLMGLDQLRAFAIKYAGWPYPFATVRVQVSGDDALVTRTLARGPLTQSGSTERWSRTNGQWQRISISRW